MLPGRLELNEPAACFLPLASLRLTCLAAMQRCREAAPARSHFAHANREARGPA